MTDSRVARRLAQIQPFYVMDILARARELEAQGRSVVHLEIGEPDFPTPRTVIDAGIESLRAGKTHYTPALGLPALRQAIAAHYAADHRPDPGRVVVTPGASGALQLLFATLLNPGDEILLADPGYPCNRHFARVFEAGARAVPVGPEHGFQMTAELIRAYWSERTAAVLVASPSNPTGTLVPEREMAAIVRTVEELGGTLIVDEIYHGLTYDAKVTSALAHSADVVVVNSFSKYYGMTGWRVGWLVAPPFLIDPVERLAQNMFIAAPTPAQYAALAAFEESTLTELERRRSVFQQRRDFLLPALERLGFNIPVKPEGAFYLYADASSLTGDSWQFCLDLLESAGVAVTPGRDFGDNRPQRYVRFSYANRIENLEKAVDRLQRFLAA